MAITRLKRKARKNRLKAKVRAQRIKLEGFTPVIKNIDVEALKEEFKTSTATKTVKPVAEKQEEKTEATVTVPKAEKVVAPKKAAPKKKEDAPTAEGKEPTEKAAPKKKVAAKAKKED